MLLRRLVLLLAVITSGALAAPPEGADLNSPKAALYQALKDERGVSCCSISDCRPANAWIEAGHWRARIPGLVDPIVVPDDKVLQHQQSPEGLQAVICLRYFGGVPEIRCFVPAGQT